MRAQNIICAVVEVVQGHADVLVDSVEALSLVRLGQRVAGHERVELVLDVH